MNIKTFSGGIILFVTLFLISCDREPILPPEPVIDYVTIAQLREMYDKGIVTIDTNIYIQGVITLTPELGNLPAFVAYIQDSTAAICITVEGTNTFAMNSEVKIFCRNLTFTLYNGLLQFGNIDIATNTEMINLTPAMPEPVSVTIDELLNGDHQSEYVSITGSQFKAAGTFSGGKVLTDCNSEIEVYTRSAAIFSGTALPAGNGTFKGIASVFNSAQLLLRDPAELNMTGGQCGMPSVTYLSQDFNTITYKARVSTLAGWKTYSETGDTTWYGNIVTGKGTWVQSTAYLTNDPSVITWMIAPQIDLSTATNPYLTFESADGYDKGATLELFVSTDYTGSTTPWTSTWTKLTFTLPPSTTLGYSAFTGSGHVDLSAYKGSTLFIAWVYKGADPAGTTSDKTTTWEVDNVIVAEE